ncbi:MAG: protein DA1 [Candidatus Sericytochromatia bacterium]|nr:protein DA1 [Candidatus Sericytochromatia bacterium]
MRCARCGEPLFGAVLRVSGAILHPDCFVCVDCRRPVQGRYVQGPSGSVHHPQCFARCHAEACTICGQGLVGRYLVDPDGHRYHGRHLKEFPRCATCGHLCAPGLAGRAIGLGDGRAQCGACHRKAVRGTREALPRWQRVVALLGEWGVEVDVDDVPLELVDRVRLHRLLQQAGQRPHPSLHGLTRHHVHRRGGRVVRQDVSVFAVTCLPAELLDGILAHELGHVWIHQNGCPVHQPELAEGACNVLRWMVHVHQGTEDADRMIREMEADPHPAYGGGFRRARRMVERHGLPKLLEHLRRSAGFPLLAW